MRVGHLHTEALKEPLIHGVEEGLLLVEIGDGGGGVFNRAVEMFQTLAEIVTAEHAGIERRDDFFNFLRDDVARDKIGHVENLAEDALGEQVLDQHLLYGIVLQVGIDGLPTNFGKHSEPFDEGLVGLPLRCDQFHRSGGYLWNTRGKFVNGGFPLPDMRLAVLEELAQDIDEFLGLRDVVVKGD